MHHSEIESESLSNYGGLFSIWDRLLGTYVPQPAGGHLKMRVGVKGYQSERSLSYWRALVSPVWDRAFRAPETATPRRAVSSEQ